MEAMFSTKRAGTTISKSKDVDTITDGVTFCAAVFNAEFGCDLPYDQQTILADHGVLPGGYHFDLPGEGAFTVHCTIAPSYDSGEDLQDFKPDPRNPIYLYVIARTDLASFTGTPDDRKAGLPCAQTGHAANQMVYQVRKKNIAELNNLLTEWENETGMGFGTEIVLGAHYSKVKQVVEHAALRGFHAAMVKDPQYPLRDGESLHLIPLETCGYIFGRKNELTKLLSGYDLLP